MASAPQIEFIVRMVNLPLDVWSRMTALPVVVNALRDEIRLSTARSIHVESFRQKSGSFSLCFIIPGLQYCMTCYCVIFEIGLSVSRCIVRTTWSPDIQLTVIVHGAPERHLDIQLWGVTFHLPSLIRGQRVEHDKAPPFINIRSRHNIPLT